MVFKQGDTKRHEKNETILKSGGYAYRMLPYWAQIPAELKNAEITAVSCDSEDRVFILTRNFDMPIMVFDPHGRFLYSCAQGVFFERPHGIYFNRQDELYCTDDKAHVVMKLTKKGELLKTYGNPGQPSDTGCNRNAYKEYREKEKVPASVPFDNGKSLQMQLDSIIRCGPPFNGPTRMIEAPSGELFCTDGYGNAAVHHFTAEGKLIKTWGEPGREPGQFRLPHGLLMDRAGRIWVADRENNRLQIFDTGGNLLICVDNLLRPTELCTDGTFIYVSESDGGFSIFDQEANPVAQFGYRFSSLYLHGIGINSKGDLFGATLSKNKFNNLIKLERLE